MPKHENWNTDIHFNLLVRLFQHMVMRMIKKNLQIFIQQFTWQLKIFMNFYTRIFESSYTQTFKYTYQIIMMKITPFCIQFILDVCSQIIAINTKTIYISVDIHHFHYTLKQIYVYINLLAYPNIEIDSICISICKYRSCFWIYYFFT